MSTQNDRGQIVPPTRTGHKATLMMQIDVMVEVNETDDYNDMVRQAKEALRKRVVESKGFYPFRSQCIALHPEVEVDDLRYQTEVQGGTKW